LCGVIEVVAVGGADDEDVDVGGSSAWVVGVAGGPGAEDVGILDAREFGEFLGDDLAGAEGAQQ
jgi:hypothetical protein